MFQHSGFNAFNKCNATNDIFSPQVNPSHLSDLHLLATLDQDACISAVAWEGILQTLYNHRGILSLPNNSVFFKPHLHGIFLVSVVHSQGSHGNSWLVDAASLRLDPLITKPLLCLYGFCPHS